MDSIPLPEVASIEPDQDSIRKVVGPAAVDLDEFEQKATETAERALGKWIDAQAAN